MLSCSAQAPFVPPAPTATTPLPLQRGKGGGGGAQAGLALALRDPEKGGRHGRRRRREQGADPPPQPLTSADPAVAAMDLARLDARGAHLYSFLRCPPRGRPPLRLPLMAAARSSASAPPSLVAVTRRPTDRHRSYCAATISLPAPCRGEGGGPSLLRLPAAYGACRPRARMSPARTRGERERPGRKGEGERGGRKDKVF